ncbi:MAG: tetratricopeptide repeat protein [Bradymonadia bacterium]
MSIDKRQVLDQAQKLLDKGLIDRAIKQYLKILEVDPDDVFVLQKIAGLHVKNGSDAYAVEYYEKAFRVFKAKGFHEKCVGALKRLLEIESTRLDFHHELAKSQVALGRVKEASQTFKSLIGVYERRGDRDTSLSMLRELVQISPDDWTNRTRLAEGYAATGKDILAINSFKEVLNALLASGQLEEHARISERVLFLYPSENDVAIELSRNYLSRSLLREALSWLHILFKDDPKNEQTLEILGDVFVMQGRVDKALAVFREAMRLHAASGQTRAQATLADKIRQLDDNADLSNDDTPRPVVLTSRHPTAVQPVASSASLVADVALLIEFELLEHALKRTKMIPGDYVPNDDQVQYLESFSRFVETAEEHPLRDELILILERAQFVSQGGGDDDAPVETPPDNAESFNSEALEFETPAHEESKQFELIDDVNIDEIDFSEYGELSEMMEPPMSVIIDESEDDEFGFDVDLDAESGLADPPEASIDEFSDLLSKARPSSAPAVITPEVSPSILETKERFPLIRPHDDNLTSKKPTADDTSEMSFVSINDEALRSQNSSTVNADDDSDFGGLLEPDED